MNSYESFVRWIAYIGLGLLLLTPLIVSQSMYFPFITGKNFFFRIVTEIVFVAWVSLAVLDASFRPRKSVVLYAFGGFVGIATLAGILGVNPYQSFWSNFERMEGTITYLHLFALFLAAAHILKNKMDWLRFSYVSIGVATFVALFTLGEGFDVIKGYGTEDRPFATFGNFIYLAVYLMTHMFVVGGLLASEWKNPLKRWTLIAVELVLLGAFLLPASRGAFLGLLAGVGTMTVLILIFSKQRTFKYGAAAIVMAGLCLLGGIKMYPNSFIVKQVPLFSRFSEIFSTDIKNQPRIKIWGMAIEAARERPVLGWGPDTFIVPFAKYYNPSLFGNEPWFDRTHNVFLEWLVDAGILGFIAFLSIHAAALYTLFRLWKSRTLHSVIALAFAGGYGAYLAQNFFVFDTITTYLTLVFALAFLHTVSVEHGAKNTKPVDPAFAAMVPAGALVAIVLLVSFLNVRPIQAATGAIDVLQSFQKQTSFEEIAQRTDEILALRTLGSREIRERIGIVSMDYALKATQPNDNTSKLLSFAIAKMEEQVADEPEVLKNKLLLARLLAIQDARGPSGVRSEKLYEEALSEAPGYVQNYISFAELRMVQGKFPEALQLVNTAYQISGEKRSLLIVIVNVYLQGGDIVGAQKILTEKIASGAITILADEEINSMLQRVMGINDTAKRLDIIKFLEMHTANKDGTAELHIAFAQTYADLGNKTEAIKHAERAVQMDPKYTSAVDAWLKTMGGQ